MAVHKSATSANSTASEITNDANPDMKEVPLIGAKAI